MSTRYVWEKYNKKLELQVSSAAWRTIAGPDPAPSTISVAFTSDVNDLQPSNPDASSSSAAVIATPERSVTLRLSTLGNNAGEEDINAGEYFQYKNGPVYYSEESTTIRYFQANGITGSTFLLGSSGSARRITYKAVKGTAVGTVSNAAASTYPRHNYTGQITSICAIIPVLLRRCEHVA